MTIRVVGEGWITGVRPHKIPDKLLHSERWVEDKSGGYRNVVPKRKNKRGFPEFDPILYPRSE